MDINKFQKITVTKCDKNEKIFSYLKKLGYSQNYITNLKKQEGFILLNNTPVFVDHKLKPNDEILITKNPNIKTTIKSLDLPLCIVYEDNDILVVNKPSNLACMPSKSHYTNNLAGAIVNYMQNKDNNFVLRIINRLDKDTAGLVIIAKNSLIANQLNSGNFIQKTYYCLCEGIIKDSMVINKNILTTKNSLGFNNLKREISSAGKPASTYVTPVSYFSNYTLCKVKLEHGRTHQIRLHMSCINHSLLGDELYGQKSDLIDHTSLVCKEISIFHPTKKINININIDFPDDFKKLI